METTENRVKVEEEPEIHLFIERSETAKLMDATVPIRWCICPDIYQRLKEQEVKKPYLLLVMVDKDDYEERKLVPLENMMEYIMFQKPGQHRIFAAILWHKRDNSEKLKDYFLNKSGRGYLTAVLSHDKSMWTFSSDFPFKAIGPEMITVEIAEQFFAKEPPKWLKEWANLCFKDTPRDQCQLRRRCIFAFSLQVFLFLILMASILVFGVLPRILVSLFLFLFCGCRGVNFSVCIDPERELPDIWANIDSCFFVSNRKGKLRLWLLPFMPIILLGLFGTVWLLGWLKVFPFVGEMTIGKSILAVPLIVLMAEFLGWIGWIGWMLYLVVSPSIKFRVAVNKMAVKEKRVAVKKIAAKEEKEKQRLEKLYLTQFSPLVCTGDALKPDINALPTERRTIHLRFWGLKRRVCKPFARS